MDLYNPALVAAVISWMTAQIAKTITYVISQKKLTVERLWGAGGMPSSHSAGVCGLAVAVARVEGLYSAAFAIAAILALIVMYDASGVRRAAGMHAREINRIKIIVNKLDAEIHTENVKEEETIIPKTKKRRSKKNKLEEQMEQLKEFLGHSPLEVFFGAMVGIGIGIIIPIL